MTETAAGAASNRLLQQIQRSDPPAFALLHRPDSDAGPEQVELLVGDVARVDCLADLPLPETAPLTTGGAARHDFLAVVPFAQIRERGFACRNDGEPILSMAVHDQARISVSDAVRSIADMPIALQDADFDIDDDTYADMVRTILADEIGQGAGSNFVIKRSFVATIPQFGVDKALAIFRRLLLSEVGAYWTFLVHTGTRTFVGATPERHASLEGGALVMNPISGTYRYPASGPRFPELLSFLSDRKEAEELYMVVDEELKMMARVCDAGGRVDGPYLKEMAQLAHTEYLLRGHSSHDVRDILRETMFAPTVTGSPLENACRVIARHEPTGRGYYSGVLALVGRDGDGPVLDSSILIRTADIDRSGRLQLGVGATLVRLSDAESEVAETRAKAAGMLAALGAREDGAADPPAGPRRRSREKSRRIANHPEVRSALRVRNAKLARYWLEEEGSRDRAVPQLSGRRVLVIDAEDTFTAMLRRQLRALGLVVLTRPYHDVRDVADFDLVVVGPGPGDPRDGGDAKIAALRDITRRLIADEVPFLAVCLGHQVLAAVLGLAIRRKRVPSQGEQREVDLFGRRQVVGFYNTFAAWCAKDRIELPGLPDPVEVSRDVRSGEVHALRGRRFASLQFHPESILTQDGPTILRELLTALIGRDLDATMDVRLSS